MVDGEEGTLPEPIAALARVLLAQIAALSAQVDALEKQLRRRAATDETVRRLMTIPGVGVIAATALTTFAPPPETFAKGRDFAAWVGLTPRQHSSGGKERLGRTSKMGQRDIRRLLIIGAVATVRWAARKGAPEGSWLARMLAKKPRMLVAVALANRMARLTTCPNRDPRNCLHPKGRPHTAAQGRLHDPVLICDETSLRTSSTTSKEIGGVGAGRSSGEGRATSAVERQREAGDGDGSLEPDAVVSGVARRFDVRRQQVHDWRRAARQGELGTPGGVVGFLEVLAGPARAERPCGRGRGRANGRGAREWDARRLHNLAAVRDGEIGLAGGRLLLVPVGLPTAELQRLIGAVEGA